MKGITMAVSVGMAVAASAVAAPGMQLAPLFGDHAVLQRGKTIPIWGEGSQPRAKLACRLGNAVTWTRANGDGTFVFYLPPQEAGGPFELSVTNETRTGRVPAAEVFVCSRDVYVGEVWLCSGQSNMAFSMQQAEPGFGGETVERLRIFTVPWNCQAGRPADRVAGVWAVASPAAVQGKSAVATFFGRELERELGCAVGMLQAAVGGTLAQNWTSRTGLLAHPIGRRIVEEYEIGLSDPAVWKAPPPLDKEQLANYGPGRRYEKRSPWSELRFAQMRLSRDIPGVGLVSAIDLGEAANIHPPDKLGVGKRLANWAMADVYGDKDRVATGPRFLSASIADGKVTVRFTDTGTGLATRDGATAGGLMLAGADGEFHPAEGAIKGDTLVVSSSAVPEPRAIRYAWAKNPLGANLVNREGYPASPFRWEMEGINWRPLKP